MGKIVKAVCPYIYPTGSNFKVNPYNTWKKLYPKAVSPSHYPARGVRKFFSRYGCPSFFESKKEARLVFCEARNLNFDAFPSYILYEVIPLIWDCWPKNDKEVVSWFKKHNVKKCILTSTQASERIRMVLPNINVLTITEGICVENYPAGLELKDREIDRYNFGRFPEWAWKKELYDGYVRRGGGSDDEFIYGLTHGKITNAFPRCDVFTKDCEGQETLTQRYWECMLSRIVMLGRAPKELIDLIGYNPVVEFSYSSSDSVENIANHYFDLFKYVHNNIDNYQELVDKNRITALRMAPWEIRMTQIAEWLVLLGYEIEGYGKK